MSQASFTSLWNTWIPLPLFHIFPYWEYTCQSGHGPVTFLPSPVFTPVLSSVWPRNLSVFWIKLWKKALCCVRNQVYFVCFSHVYVFLCQAGMWGEKCLHSTLSAPDQNSLHDKLKRRVLKKLFSVMYRSPNPFFSIHSASSATITEMTSSCLKDEDIVQLYVRTHYHNKSFSPTLPPFFSARTDTRTDMKMIWAILQKAASPFPLSSWLVRILYGWQMPHCSVAIVAVYSVSLRLTVPDCTIHFLTSQFKQTLFRTGCWWPCRRLLLSNSVRGEEGSEKLVEKYSFNLSWPLSVPTGHSLHWAHSLSIHSLHNIEHKTSILSFIKDALCVHSEFTNIFKSRSLSEYTSLVRFCVMNSHLRK